MAARSSFIVILSEVASATERVSKLGGRLSECNLEFFETETKTSTEMLGKGTQLE